MWYRALWEILKRVVVYIWTYVGGKAVARFVASRTPYPARLIFRWILGGGLSAAGISAAKRSVAIHVLKKAFRAALALAGAIVVTKGFEGLLGAIRGLTSFWEAVFGNEESELTHRIKQLQEELLAAQRSQQPHGKVKHDLEKAKADLADLPKKRDMLQTLVREHTGNVDYLEELEATIQYEGALLKDRFRRTQPAEYALLLDALTAAVLEEHPELHPTSKHTPHQRSALLIAMDRKIEEQMNGLIHALYQMDEIMDRERGSGRTLLVERSVVERALSDISK